MTDAKDRTRVGHWLLKSEPDAFSLDDLFSMPKRTDHWDGIRNHQARNFMRDGMKKGDLAFYYHSNAKPSAIVGICEVVREGYPDAGAFARELAEWREGARRRERALELVAEASSVLDMNRPDQSRAKELREAAAAQPTRVPTVTATRKP